MSFRAGLLAISATACLTLWSAPPALAADPELKLPSFENLQHLAVESVNLTIGKWPLSFAATALESSEDAQDRELLGILKGLKAIHIHSFKFASDGQFDAAQVEAVRNQLSAPGWNALAKIRQHGQTAENVDIYVSTDHEVVNGLAVIASGPRELTIVNIVGSVDPAKLVMLSHRLGLPGLAM